MKNLIYALTFAFILLKVTEYIDWSWWLVLLPFYCGLPVLFTLHVIIAFLEARKKSIDEFNNQRTVRKSKFQTRLDAYMEQQTKNT